MRSIRIATTAGFCKGVKRAVEKTLTVAKDKKNKTVTLGPVIHNPQVLDQLRQLGIKSIDTPDQAAGKHVIIRAHGIPPDVRNKLKSMNADICDATCPDVARVQGIVKKYTNRGYSVVIIGDAGHAEVKGLLGFAGNKGYVIASKKDLSMLPAMEKLCIIAQTTQQKEKFLELQQALQERYAGKECLVFDTICPATEERQNEVHRIAQEVDLMIVIGGRNSANTCRLAQIAQETGAKTLHIETDEELANIDISKYPKIGITAGASTPNWMIRQVVLKIKEKQRQSYPAVLRWMAILWDFVRNANILLAFAAGWLSYASCYLQHLYSRKEYFLISFFYIFAIYTVNSMQKKSYLKLDRSSKLFLYKENRPLLIAMVVIAIATLLLVTYMYLGIIPFMASLLLLIFGSLFQFIGLPLPKSGGISFKKVTKIPGSKDFVVIIGWAIMVVLVPLLSSRNLHYNLSFPKIFSSIAAFFFVATFVAIRSILNDIREIQEDLMVGIETLPIYLGTKRVIKILFILVCVSSLLLVIGSLYHLVSYTAFFLLIPLWSLYVLSLYNNKLQYALNIDYIDIVDFHFILAGVISYSATFA
ncbi:MAG: 4-hydroxy-3-methylbut-2-enyl diphosphate reductase [Candidatus Auribacterota bacterium]|jgi:4-hydroxy-3-methylbut-2-enyl diphosphate reductase|nr:4-hydroxy-3-methylbut-2-enyl diphosphate reductase [Candidatus Auribacterota bacterium]